MRVEGVGFRDYGLESRVEGVVVREAIDEEASGFS